MEPDSPHQARNWYWEGDESGGAGTEMGSRIRTMFSMIVHSYGSWAFRIMPLPNVLCQSQYIYYSWTMMSLSRTWPVWWQTLYGSDCWVHDGTEDMLDKTDRPEEMAWHGDSLLVFFCHVKLLPALYYASSVQVLLGCPFKKYQSAY